MVNYLILIQLLTQICFFSLLSRERSHFQTPNSTKMLGSLSLLSGLSKKDSESIAISHGDSEQTLLQLEKITAEYGQRRSDLPGL